MEIPRQALIDGEVIKENEAYDFPRWFYVVSIGKEFFERSNMESTLLRTAVKKIQEEILNIVEALFAKRLTDEELTMDNLKDKLHEFFFVESFSREHIENVSLFSSIMCKTQEIVPRWEKFFSKCKKDTVMLEYKLATTPNVSVGELEAVMTRFITFSIKERDNGRPILDENLLNA